MNPKNKSFRPAKVLVELRQVLLDAPVENVQVLTHKASILGHKRSSPPQRQKQESPNIGVVLAFPYCPYIILL